jgi:hypothetical protein
MGRLVQDSHRSAGFVALIALAGFFVLPPVAKSILVKKASGTAPRQVSWRGSGSIPLPFASPAGASPSRKRTGRPTFSPFRS